MQYLFTGTVAIKLLLQKINLFRYTSSVFRTTHLLYPLWSPNAQKLSLFIESSAHKWGFNERVNVVLYNTQPILNNLYQAGCTSLN